MKVIDSFANYLIDILMLTKEFQYYLDNQDELGTFLIQECTEGDSAYTETFHSRVIFV